MKRKTFELIYMVPDGTDEKIYKRIVRTFQTKLTNEPIKENVFEVERAAAHWPLELNFIGTDEV